MQSRLIRSCSSASLLNSASFSSSSAEPESIFTISTSAFGKGERTTSLAVLVRFMGCLTPKKELASFRAPGERLSIEVWLSPSFHSSTTFDSRIAPFDSGTSEQCSFPASSPPSFAPGRGLSSFCDKNFSSLLNPMRIHRLTCPYPDHSPLRTLSNTALGT